MALGALPALLIFQLWRLWSTQPHQGRPNRLGQGPIITPLPHLALQGRGDFEPFGPMVQVAVVLNLVPQLFETAVADSLRHPGEGPQLPFRIGEGKPSRRRHIQHPVADGLVELQGGDIEADQRRAIDRRAGGHRGRRRMAAPGSKRWSWGWPVGAQAFGLGPVEIDGTVPQTPQHFSPKLQRVTMGQRPVVSLRRQPLQRRRSGPTAALGVGEGAGFKGMVELLQTAP